jgi:hypothetical protein
LQALNLVSKKRKSKTVDLVKAATLLEMYQSRALARTGSASVEQSVARKLNFSEVIDRFAVVKARKMD